MKISSLVMALAVLLPLAGSCVTQEYRPQKGGCTTVECIFLAQVMIDYKDCIIAFQQAEMSRPLMKVYPDDNFEWRQNFCMNRAKRRYNYQMIAQ